jgi:hypothetical protein
MSKTKKIILAFAVIFVAFVTLYLYDMTRFYDPYRNVTSEVKAMYRDFDVVAIEVTVEDMDGVLAKAGLDTAVLKNEALKAFERQFHKKVEGRDLKISLLDQPYNLDNHPQAFVVSLYLAVRGSAVTGYYYKEDMKIIRKMKDGKIKDNVLRPTDLKIMPEDNLKQLIPRMLYGRFEGSVRAIAHWN